MDLEEKLNKIEGEVSRLVEAGHRADVDYESRNVAVYHYSPEHMNLLKEYVKNVDSLIGEKQEKLDQSRPPTTKSIVQDAVAIPTIFSGGLMASTMIPVMSSEVFDCGTTIVFGGLGLITGGLFSLIAVPVLHNERKNHYKRVNREYIQNLAKLKKEILKKT